MPKLRDRTPQPLATDDSLILDPLSEVFNMERGPIKAHPRTCERNYPDIITRIGIRKFIRRDRWKALLAAGDEGEAA